MSAIILWYSSLVKDSHYGYSSVGALLLEKFCARVAMQLLLRRHDVQNSQLYSALVRDEEDVRREGQRRMAQRTGHVQQHSMDSFMEQVYARFWYEAELRKARLLRDQRSELARREYGRMAQPHLMELEERLMMIHVEAILLKVEADAAGVKTDSLERYWYYGKESAI